MRKGAASSASGFRPFCSLGFTTNSSKSLVRIVSISKDRDENKAAKKGAEKCRTKNSLWPAAIYSSVRHFPLKGLVVLFPAHLKKRKYEAEESFVITPALRCLERIVRRAIQCSGHINEQRVQRGLYREHDLL